MVSDKISLIYAREAVNNIPNNSSGIIKVVDARLIYKEFSLLTKPIEDIIQKEAYSSLPTTF